jgi:hypothetical protein
MKPRRKRSKNEENRKGNKARDKHGELLRTSL